MISEYWQYHGKTEADKRHGRTFQSSFGNRCAECCNGDRCDDPTHYDRENCPCCLGTGTNAGPCLRPLGCDCPACIKALGPIHRGNVGKNIHEYGTLDALQRGAM